MARGKIAIVFGQSLVGDLTGAGLGHKVRCAEAGEGNPVHARAVKRVHECSRIAHQHEAVAGEGGAVVSEIPPPMLVLLAVFRIGDHLAPDGMLHEESFYPLTDAAAVLREIHQPLIPHHADAHVTALEGDPPAPPAVADDMIGGRVAGAVDRTRPIREFLRQLAAVPVLHARPARPSGGGRVLGIRPPPTFLAGDQRAHARGVDDPARTDRAPRVALLDLQRLLAAGDKLDFRDGGGPHDLGARHSRAAEHLLVKGSPVKLEGWNPREVFRTDFTGIGQGVDVVVLKPEPHALLHQMVLI